MQSIVVKEIASAREYQSRLAQLGPHGSVMGQVLAGVNLDPGLDPMEFSRRVQAQADYYDCNRETDFLARYQVLIDRLTSYRAGPTGKDRLRGFYEVDREMKCPSCKGSGIYLPGIGCRRCGGKGSVPDPTPKIEERQDFVHVFLPYRIPPRDAANPGLSFELARQAIFEQNETAVRSELKTWYDDGWVAASTTDWVAVRVRGLAGGTPGLFIEPGTLHWWIEPVEYRVHMRRLR